MEFNKVCWIDLKQQQLQPCSHVACDVTILLARFPVFKDSNHLALILSMPAII